MFSSGTLEFDDTKLFSSPTPGVDDSDIHNRFNINRKIFKTWVKSVLKLHKGPHLDGLIIRFAHLRLRARFDRPVEVDRWIYFAMKKEVKLFELNLSICGRMHPFYEFPSVDKLLSQAKFGFGFLRSLRFVDVDIKDDVVEYFLASCRYLEELCIRASFVTENIRVVGASPNLKVLEISKCNHLSSLEVSARNLVSCTYEGGDVNLPFKKTPNLSELTLGDGFCRSFMYEPDKHSSYSVQLVKLVLNLHKVFPPRHVVPPDLPLLCSLKRLELNVVAAVDERLHFFTSLVKASPLLNEFQIKISYVVLGPWNTNVETGFPSVGLNYSAKYYRCCHKNLKVVKMSGYVGCSSDNEFILELLEIAPALETVLIDTQSDYYEEKVRDCPSDGCGLAKCKCKLSKTAARTRIEAQAHAHHLKLRFPPQTALIVT